MSAVAEMERVMSGAPADWRQVTLGNVVRIVTDGISVANLASLPEVHHYSLPAFDDGAGPEVGPGDAIKSNKTVVPDDCVLFSKLNPRIPRIWRVHGDAPSHSYCSTEFWPLVAQGSGVDLDYLTQYLSSAAFLGHPDITPSSSTNSHQRVDRKAFERFEFAIPPLDEQRRIAEVLRSVDEAIAANNFALNQARLLQSCIGEDFLAKHSHDEQVMLRDVVVETGSGWSPGCDPEAARPEEWGILKTSAITWDGYDDSECKRLPDDLEAKPDLAVRANDILITRAGQAYRTGVVAFVFATSGTRMLSDKMIRIRADEAKILPLVLCQVLKGSSVQGQLNPLKSGLTTLTNITQKMIGDVTFPLPAMAGQRVFMQAVKSVDEQIGYFVREANYLGGLKAALSADLLSGRVRVPA